MEYLKYGDIFFEKSDYYRSITMYELALFQNNNQEMDQEINMKIGNCYFKAEKWTDAVKCFAKALQFAPNSKLSPELSYKRALSEYKAGEINLSIHHFKQTAEQYPNSNYSYISLYLVSYVYLLKNDWNNSAKTIENITDTYSSTEFSNYAENLRTEILKGKDLKYKSRRTAKIFAIFPGFGHFYAKQYKEGAITLLLNSIFGFFVYDSINKAKNIENYNYTTAYIWGAIELPFYIGNIYGASRAVEKYNNGINKQFTFEIERKWRTPLLELGIDF